MGMAGYELKYSSRWRGCPLGQEQEREKQHLSRWKAQLKARPGARYTQGRPGLLKIMHSNTESMFRVTQHHNYCHYIG